MNDGLRVACRHEFDGGFKLDVQFAAPRGVTALFGPSGAGKSTVLSIIAGLLRPQSGSVHVADRCLLDRAADVDLPPQRRGVGLVPQDDLLFPHLSVRRNLTFGMRCATGVPLNFDRAVSVLRLGDLLDRSPATLSGGQRQRVTLGRAVLRGPDVLLMDEPINAQDEALKHSLIHDLCDIVAQLDVVAIFVSHDQNDVRRFAKNTVLLDSGRVLSAGPTAETLDAAVRSPAAGILAPTNMVRVTDVRPDGGAWLGRIGENVVVLPEPKTPYAESVYVAFHPADVLLARADVTGLSVRNHWRGKVLDVVASVGQVFVHVDVGQPIWAEITPAAQRALALRPGDALICLVKTAALRMLDTRPHA